MTRIREEEEVNKTIVKPRIAATMGHQYVYVGFSRRKILRCSAYTILEKAIRLRQLDYNPDRAQKLISSMSRYLSTCNISSKSMHTFLSNFANRPTDRQRQTRTKTCTCSCVEGNNNTSTWHELVCLLMAEFYGGWRDTGT